MHFGSVQSEAQVQTHIVFCTSLSGQSYQVKSERSISLALLQDDLFSQGILSVRGVQQNKHL